jgi:hypothetical protein
VRDRFDISKFPTWRKVVIICGIATACLMGSAVVSRELDIYASAPKTPNTAVGQVFPVHVMHGYVRYLSGKDYEHLTFWRPLVGLPVLAALLAAVTSREFWRAIG